MADFIPKILSRWATPKEFDVPGKEITIVNFEVLSLQEIIDRDGRPPLYPPELGKADHDGYVRRLTFMQEGHNGERTLDSNSKRFQNDLSGKIPGKGVKGILMREQNGKRNKWDFKTNPIQV